MNEKVYWVEKKADTHSSTFQVHISPPLHLCFLSSPLFLHPFLPPFLPPSLPQSDSYFLFPCVSILFSLPPSPHVSSFPPKCILSPLSCSHLCLPSTPFFHHTYSFYLVLFFLLPLIHLPVLMSYTLIVFFPPHSLPSLSPSPSIYLIPFLSSSYPVSCVRHSTILYPSSSRLILYSTPVFPPFLSSLPPSSLTINIPKET